MKIKQVLLLADSIVVKQLLLDKETNTVGSVCIKVYNDDDDDGNVDENVDGDDDDDDDDNQEGCGKNMGILWEFTIREFCPNCIIFCWLCKGDLLTFCVQNYFLQLSKGDGQILLCGFCP